MRDIVRRSIRNPNQIVRNQAIEIVSYLPSKDFKSELDAIYHWVRDNIRFVRDVRGVETLQTPEATLRLGAGDCDDHVMLIQALAESVGFVTRSHAVGFRPGHFSHVLAEVKFGKRWVPLETTVNGAFIGWFPPGVQAHMVQDLQNF